MVRLMVLVLVLSATTARAQGEVPAFVLSVAKSVALDPTTYGPAPVIYAGQMLDWKTSQPLFRAGYAERNKYFTVSGRPNDTPLSEADGNRKIAGFAAIYLGQSVIHNAASHAFERALLVRYPKNKKLVRAIMIGERIAFAAIRTYMAGAVHYRQAAANRRMAAAAGIR